MRNSAITRDWTTIQDVHFTVITPDTAFSHFVKKRSRSFALFVDNRLTKECECRTSENTVVESELSRRLPYPSGCQRFPHGSPDWFSLQKDIRAKRQIDSAESCGAGYIRFSFARALLNCSERSPRSHGLDCAKSRPDCPVTWPKGRKIGELGRKGSRKRVHPVRGVSVLGLESLSFNIIGCCGLKSLPVESCVTVGPLEA